MAALRGYLKRRMRDGQDLDDMVQDVYLRVLSTPETGPVANVRGFLRRVASNLLIDRYRRKAARLSDNHTTLDEQIVDDGALRPSELRPGGRNLPCWAMRWRRSGRWRAMRSCWCGWKGSATRKRRSGWALRPRRFRTMWSARWPAWPSGWAMPQGGEPR
jgi:DNA-directed RNA polymerase specialized sigma24 family protein